MVNPGHPSEGCIQCKERHVKCDAAKPACLNCYKLGKICPGYPERPSVQFRDYTDRTRRRAQTMYAKLQSRTDQQDNLEASVTDSSSDNNRARSSSEKKPKKSSPKNAAQPMRTSLEPFVSSQIVLRSVSALSGHLNRRGFAAYVDRMHDAMSMYSTATGPLKSSVELMALCALADESCGSQYEVPADFDKMRSRVIKDLDHAIEQLKKGWGSHEETLLAVQMMLLIDCFFNFRQSSSVEVQGVLHTHFEGMSAIVNHAGAAMLETELGRELYANIFMYHLHTYSPSTDIPPIPGPVDAVEILVNYSHTTPEYCALPLLKRSFDLRREAMRLFAQNPHQWSTEVMIDLKNAVHHLRHDLETLWACLPAARKFGGSSMCRWVVCTHWVHRILVEDTHIRCLNALRLLRNQPQAYAYNVEISIQKAQLAVDAICQGMPYSFTAADLPAPEEEPPTFQDVLYSWNGHMVDTLSREQHAGIAYARAACARAAGLKEPIVTLPRVLLKVN